MTSRKKPPRYIIGVDLGGTNIAVAALDENGKNTHGLRSEPTRSEQGAEGVVDRMVRMIDTFRLPGCRRRGPGTAGPRARRGPGGTEPRMAQRPVARHHR
jgi:predicted NBD/HSP70 family sugar kinase